MDANRHKGRGVPMTLLIVGVLLAVAAIALAVYVRGLGFSASFSYEAASKNPLMGFAARADNPDAAASEQLVYIDVTWADWEPEEGEFDTAGLAQRMHVSEYRKQGKHAVLRFVCDVPGDERHMDIPQWLYDETGDGVFYDNDYGQGYSPVYENKTFMEAHAKAIAALGAWASKDTFVSYVELGSLGHWGEWHTDTSSGVPAMPSEDVCREYVNQYVSAFPSAKLLMRRNYTVGAEVGAGVYNDMVGAAEDTQEWLSWQSDGGFYESLGRTLTYQPTSEIWQSAPVGGEFTSSFDYNYMLGENLQETLRLIADSHMTFVGPHYPKSGEADDAAVAQVRDELGYRIWVSEVSGAFNPLTRCWDIAITWRNDGAAPLYWDWPATLEMRDAAGETVYKVDLPLNLSELGAGQETTVHASVPIDQRYWDGFSLAFGITDPLTGVYAVRLSQSETYADGLNVVYENKGR